MAVAIGKPRLAMRIFDMFYMIADVEEILDEIQAHPESHGGPPDCIVSLLNFWQVIVLQTLSVSQTSLMYST